MRSTYSLMEFSHINSWVGWGEAYSVDNNLVELIVKFDYNL
jgi:hypothetical protein